MSYNRAYNFSAGPSMLPLSVIETVAKELPNYEGGGESVMEMSHRSKAVSYTHLDVYKRQIRFHRCFVPILTGKGLWQTRTKGRTATN